jgi:hypothetical protein
VKPGRGHAQEAVEWSLKKNGGSTKILKSSLTHPLCCLIIFFFTFTLFIYIFYYEQSRFVAPTVYRMWA